MGLLADAYSFGDGLKRKVGGLLSDPMGTIELGINRLKEDNNNALNLFSNAYPMAGEKTVLNSPEQIAKLQKQAAEYASQVGMAGSIDFPVSWARPEKSAAIKSMADDFASKLKANGFQAQVEHSGSAAGPSSYVRIFDPQTGRFVVDPVRFSDHSKGAIQSQMVNEVRGSFDAPDVAKFYQLADDMRAKGPTDFMRMQQEREATAAAKKAAKAKAP